MSKQNYILYNLYNQHKLHFFQCSAAVSDVFIYDIVMTLVLILWYPFLWRSNGIKKQQLWVGQPNVRSLNQDLTGIEDSSVDPALSVAHGHLAAGVAEQDVGAAGPGSGRHSVGVVAAPVPHQHAVIIT